jgi:hypothetical protein
MSDMNLYTTALSSLTEGSSLLTGANPFYVSEEFEIPEFILESAIDLFLDDDGTIVESSGWTVDTAHHDAAHAKTVRNAMRGGKEAQQRSGKNQEFVQKLKSHIEKHGPDHEKIMKHLGVKSKPSGQDSHGRELNNDVAHAIRHAKLHHTHVVHGDHKGGVRTSDTAVHYVVNHKKKKVHILGVGPKTTTKDYTKHAITSISHKLHEKLQEMLTRLEDI